MLVELSSPSKQSVGGGAIESTGEEDGEERKNGKGSEEVSRKLRLHDGHDEGESRCHVDVLHSQLAAARKCGLCMTLRVTCVASSAQI